LDALLSQLLKLILINNFSLNQTFEFYQIINSENKLLQLRRKHEGSIQMQKLQNCGLIRAMSEEN